MDKRVNTTLNCCILRHHGRHSMLSFLSSLPISGFRAADTETKKFYDTTNHLYEAALLTRSYTQYALPPYKDSQINLKRHFIKIH